MKTKAAGKLAAVGTLIVLVGLAPVLKMRGNIAHGQGAVFYRVIDLGTLGGTVSTGNTINDLGWAMGASDESGDAVQLATLWTHGRQIPLGTLGGPSSDVAWPVKNNFGLISGITENGVPDPLGETFSCPVFGFSSGNSCVAFAWRDGKMSPLPGLGGNNSVGAGNNDLGQIVGWAENSVHDPTCVSGNGLTQVLQFEATVWEERGGSWQVRQLPPFPGDPDSSAVAINDLGQVAGISGTCDVAIGAYSAIHALLWQNGRPIDLGNLGGHGWNTPDAINNLGVVAGFANQPNDVVDGSLNFIPEAFVWTREFGMVGLGTLPGDAISEATDINIEGQIVGVSFADTSFDSPRAFLYQNKMMRPLNSLMSPSDQAQFFISSTGGINDFGQIAAQANIVTDGVVTDVLHAVLMVPTEAPADATSRGTAPALVVSEAAQKQMRERASLRHFGRIGLEPAKTQ
jgi:probable HAF family extracellular repeat protein